MLPCSDLKCIDVKSKKIGSDQEIIQTLTNEIKLSLLRRHKMSNVVALMLMRHNVASTSVQHQLRSYSSLLELWKLKYIGKNKITRDGILQLDKRI